MPLLWMRVAMSMSTGDNTRRPIFRSPAALTKQRFPQFAVPSAIEEAGLVGTIIWYGVDDMFVAKLNSSGCHRLLDIPGGPCMNLPSGIAVDTAGNVWSGNVYVTGTTASANFPVTGGAYQTALSAVCPYPSAIEETGLVGTIIWYGVDDMFVAKLNSSGAIVYSTYLGGPCMNLPSGIAVDTAGNVCRYGHLGFRSLSAS